MGVNDLIIIWDTKKNQKGNFCQAKKIKTK